MMKMATEFQKMTPAKRVLMMKLIAKKLILNELQAKTAQIKKQGIDKLNQQ